MASDASARWQEQDVAGNVLLFAPKAHGAREEALTGASLLYERPTARASTDPHGSRKREMLAASDLRSTPDGVHVRTAGHVIARRVPASVHSVVWISIEDESGISNVAVPAALHSSERAVLEASSYVEVEGRLRNSKGTLHIEASRVTASARDVLRFL